MNPSKTRGTAFETAVASHLRDNGLRVERRALSGKLDKGDLTGESVKDWALELKNCKTTQLGTWMDESLVEAQNAKVRWHAVIHKRIRRGTPCAYVTMPLYVFTEILQELEATQTKLPIPDFRVDI